MITYQRKAGTTDVSVVIRIIDSTDGTPETGVVFNTAGIDLWYRRETAVSVDIVEADLATPALTDAHADGGFLHINDGYYRLDLPDAACAAGVVGVLVGGVVTGMVVIGCYIQLEAIDRFDAVRLGLTALPNAAADAAGGLPISDVGGLDLDTQIGTDIDDILADTNELQADDYPTSIAAIKAETALIVADTNELQTDDYPASIAAVKAETALILADTTLIVEDTNELQTDDYPTSIAAVKAETALILADTTLIVADTNELQTDDYPTSIAAIKAETALIVADTNELQTDDYPTSIAAVKAETALLLADTTLIVEDTNELQTDDYPTSIAAIKAETALIVADTNELQTDDTPAAIVALDAKIDILDTNVDQIETAVITNAAGVDVAADIIALKAETALIVADTDELQTDNVPGLIGALAIPTTAEIVDKVLGRSIAAGADGGRTIQDALRAIRNRRAVVLNVLTVYEEDDLTPAWTADVTTSAGNPVSEIDPI